MTSSEDTPLLKTTIAESEHLGPVDEGPAPNIWQTITLIMVKLWGVVAVNFREILRIDQCFPHHALDPHEDISTKGFTAVGAYSNGVGKSEVANSTHNPPTQLVTEEITTDHGEILQRARIQALSQRNSKASRYYEALHQKFALLSRFAYQTRSHHPKVLAKVKKRFFSFRRRRPLHGSKTMEGHQFWAVLIGIDGYQNSLQGCVADAHIMENYLTDTLHVPKEQIQRLLSRRPDDSSLPIPDKYSLPTRANIIDALLGLSTNSKINEGDSIIIFFSGHGSGYYCPDCHCTIFGTHSPDSISESELANEHHRNRCPIEALCPVDRDTLDHEGVRIPDISDREMNNILSHIHRTTGAHITIILDCCHAGGTTRAPLEVDARTAHSLGHGSFVQMLNSAKERMGDWHGYRDVWADKWIPDMDSHVALAACQDYQYAKEWPNTNGYSGVFTHALVTTLRSGTLPEDATYVDLIEAIPILSGQTPVLAGKRMKERLWF